MTRITIFYHIIAAAFYAAFIIFEHYFRSTKPEYCYPIAFVGKDYMKRLFGFYPYFRIIVTVLINTWLIIVTSILSRTIRKQTDDWTLQKNNKRLLVIIWSFIIVYSAFDIQEVLVFIGGYRTLFAS